ncbi:acetyltransferase [Dapis sp. BLCC M126]|uniref:acetyltransferase n=1 Tax=Dapis sp. BLCC M126 TaxID=3400189 RepID=UPI003CF64210
MFLKHKQTDDLIEIIRIEDVYDPCLNQVMGKSHSGEEMQDPTIYLKADLMFPSGENLPVCWLDPNYRIKKTGAKSTRMSIS